MTTTSTPALFLHDTRSGSKREFIPIDPARVTVYVCGPTVYNYVHIGNGRPAVVFDVLVALLRRLYGNVAFVRNITDIDDKINSSAADNDVSISEFAGHFSSAYNEDIAGLGVAPPDVEPHATEHIPEIIAMIKRLIAAGHAYEAEGHVLFSVMSDDNYGSLSKRSVEDMIAGARVEVAPYKAHPADFVLWKPSSDDLPGWNSPWGRGRPGWHIECSAMIEKHLGQVIDIHGGGNDLVFPHHENEMAQSTCAHGQPEYVNFWLHNNMLNAGGEKMSKSLGNFVTIRDLLAREDGEVLRYALLAGHYRSTLDWSDGVLEQARASLERLYQALLDVPPAPEETPKTATAWQHTPLAQLPSTVVTALCDDLNTPGALAALHGIASAIHQTNDPVESRRLRDELLAGASALGLLHQAPGSFFQQARGDDEGQLSDVAIEELMQARLDARSARDFARADEIRDELAAAGVVLEDTREGTRWKRS